MDITNFYYVIIDKVSSKEIQIHKLTDKISKKLKNIKENKLDDDIFYEAYHHSQCLYIIFGDLNSISNVFNKKFNLYIDSMENKILQLKSDIEETKNCLLKFNENSFELRKKLYDT